VSTFLHATVYMFLHNLLNVLVQIANTMGLKKILVYEQSIRLLHLCGLVVRVLGYRFGGTGSIPGTTRFSGGKKKTKRKTCSGSGSTQSREYN
jgi:hypothetical protein